MAKCYNILKKKKNNIMVNIWNYKEISKVWWLAIKLLKKK